jgi:hypothetical protein
MSDTRDRESRAEYYRKMAQEAEQAAAKALYQETRDAFLAVAQQWRELAKLVDKRPR